MRVYNLGEEPIIYRKRSIPANGGFLEYPDLVFVPDRDMKNKYLSFGSLPKNWSPKTEIFSPEPAKQEEPTVSPVPIKEESKKRVKRSEDGTE